MRRGAGWRPNHCHWCGVSGPRNPFRSFLVVILTFPFTPPPPARPARPGQLTAVAGQLRHRTERGFNCVTHRGTHTGDLGTWSHWAGGQATHPLFPPLLGAPARPGRPGEAVMRLSTDLDPARPGSRHRVRPTLRQPAPAPTTTARPYQAHTVTPWTLAVD